MTVQTNIKNILVGLNTVEVEKVRLQGLLEQEYSKIKFKNHDGNMFVIRDCDLIIEEKYQQGYGYEDGYNYEGDMFVLCKGNNLYNRLLFPSYFKVEYSLRGQFNYKLKDQFKGKFKNLFRSTKVVPTDKLKISWVNNTYVDDNPDKFFIKISNSL